MPRALSLLFATLLTAGCAAQRSEPPPDPAPQPAPAPQPSDPPPPDWGSVPATVRVEVDPEGKTRVNGEFVHYLLPELDEQKRKGGSEVAIRLEIAPHTPWRHVEGVLGICKQLGLRNLHWRVAADPRPAVPWPLFPRGRSPRAGIVTIDWDGASETANHRWEPLAGLLGPHDPEPPRRPLTRAEVVAEVRATRARRVYLEVAPPTPFSEVFDTAEALRDTGTLLGFERP